MNKSLANPRRPLLVMLSILTIATIVGCMAEGVVCFALVHSAASTIGAAGFVVLGVLLFGVSVKLLFVWLDAIRTLWPTDR